MLERLLIEPARRWTSGRFVAAGAPFPETIAWPPNVERRVHVPPGEHCAFYNSQCVTLNIARAPWVLAWPRRGVRTWPRDSARRDEQGCAVCPSRPPRGGSGRDGEAG